MNNEDRTQNININRGNYVERIEGNYYENNYIQINTIPKPTGFPQNIPRSSTDKFVGRKEELICLHQQLQDEDKVTIAHLEGMGGIGKTELAIVYSLTNLQCNTYPGGICWLFCREQDIGLQIVNFARNYLGLNPPEDLELLDQVKWCWQRWKEGNTLIVLDDVTNYKKINSFLPPQSSQFKVLITTRLKLKLPSPLYLEILSESEALVLLTQLVGSDKVINERDTAKLLCKRLGYLPLAIQLVGQYIEEYEISLTKEINRLKDKGLDDFSINSEENNPAATSNIKGVKAAFELSWQKLDESAQKLGCLLSLFALTPIPWSLVESAALSEDQEELKQARVKLRRLYLLQNGDNYQLHQLIQEFFRDKQNNLSIAEEQKRNFCNAIAKIAAQIPQSLTVEKVNYFTPFISHITEAANIYRNWLREQDLIKPFLSLGRFYEGQGLYTQAAPWYEQCLSVAKECLGEKHLDVANILNNLAELYRKQGRYSEAEPLYLQALELRKQLLGEKHPDVATSLDNLALLYDNQGRYSEAEPLYLQALELRIKLLGEKHLDVASSLNHLAYLYENQGRYSEAEPLYLQALELRIKLLGEKHLDVALSLNNLAYLYYNQGRYSEAKPLYLQALELRKQLLGEEHPDVATSLNNLALLYYKQGRYSEAETLYLQALELEKKRLGEEHPDVATSLNNLALLYYNQGRYSEAEPLYLQALGLKKQSLGKEHPDVALSLNNLALFYGDQGRYSEAKPLYLQALKISEVKLGVNHPNTNVMRGNLQYTLDKMKDRTDNQNLLSLLKKGINKIQFWKSR
ncbi:MAG: tetratricopeptide repeat protein [Xenococcus sp. (in: cyanobacteria)]